jgi:hypothetical protein
LTLERESSKVKKSESIRGTKEVQENLTFVYDSVKKKWSKRGSSGVSTCKHILKPGNISVKEVISDKRGKEIFYLFFNYLK